MLGGGWTFHDQMAGFPIDDHTWEQQALLQVFLALYWACYARLLAYRHAPQPGGACLLAGSSRAAVQHGDGLPGPGRAHRQDAGAPTRIAPGAQAPRTAAAQ